MSITQPKLLAHLTQRSLGVTLSPNHPRPYDLQVCGSLGSSLAKSYNVSRQHRMHGALTSTTPFHESRAEHAPPCFDSDQPSKCDPTSLPPLLRCPNQTLLPLQRHVVLIRTISARSATARLNSTAQLHQRVQRRPRSATCVRQAHGLRHP